ncbi:MAG: response regulator [Armatimonadota bacterium]|nr:response regulator [Armatimonadota bacterium]MDR7478862.1 response regulator [Armatimonadota bacterium]MDR7489799.1 response regulator [Armatimonadota bacterium]MDR7490679.1 response regulator [Armatimonadota bacterium]MDR7501505.1 response regulator [Armatimonadota bacterium]
MNQPPVILIADDNPANLEILGTRLAASGYRILTAADGEQALAAARQHAPDLLLLDVMMPRLDGLEVCRRLKADPARPFLPVILVTARGDPQDVVAGLDAGADEYLTKPVDHSALVARVRSMLRIKALHDTVQEQAARLEAQARQLEAWNQQLERRVAEQLAQLERVGRLRRFLSPQLAELVVSAGEERLLESHRREITAVFCDLRGFTAFAETAEPEEVLGLLREYHGAVGEVVFAFGGTLERFVGDGILVFFNDPVPVSDPALRAVRMAVAMRERVQQLLEAWRRRGHALGFGVGIAEGFATLGAVGASWRMDYTAIGTVTNLASRLCDEAAPGQILVSQRVLADVETAVEAEPLGPLVLKGFSRPVPAYNVRALRTEAAQE